MGIRGLLTMIKNGLVFDLIDLVKEAEKNGGIEILVDFHALVRFFTEVFLKKMGKDYDNEYLYLPIGVYDKCTEAFYDLHKGFGEAGIRLVWIVDGPKGVDEVASEQKSETWLKRDMQDVVTMETVLSACKYKLPLHNLDNMSPIIIFETALAALKDAGAEIINLLQGESDDFIAYEFHKRKSFAILTNDTDFVIFRDCVVIFEQLLNNRYGQNDMKLPFMDFDNPGKIFKKPSSLICPVVNQKHILKLFQFSSCSQLIALSILKGNDNTSEYAAELHYHLRITKSPDRAPHITHIAKFIKSESITAENFDQNPKIKKFMVNYPQLKESIQFCKDLYTLKRIEDNMSKSIVIYDPTVIDDSLTGFLAKKLYDGEISKKVYSIHFGIIHDSVFAEKPSEDCPPILSLLLEIRKEIYPYLLNEKLKEVTEWRSRSAGYHLVKVPVNHASFKTHELKGKPDEDSYALEKYGIDIFEEVVSHLEKEGPLNYVVKYGIEKAFICYNLRYLYVLCNGKNLKISEKEFKSIFITVFYQFALSKDIKFNTKLNQDVFLGMKICPSVRCMIIASWFMNIYFTMKYLCGAAFNLMKDFPPPSKLMSGAVFYAFFENLMSDENQRMSHLEDSLIDSVGVLEEDIMAKFEEEYKVITK